MDHNHVFGLRIVWMAVHIVRLAMSCPACMAYPDVPGCIACFCKTHKLGNLAFFLVNIKVALFIQHCDTGAVISAVFKSLKSFYENGICFPFTYVCYNSAHAVVLRVL